MLLVYSAGLAVPFLLAAFLLQHFMGSMGRIGRWLPWVNRASGVLLLALGILLITGTFTTLTAIMSSWTPEWLLDRM